MGKQNSVVLSHHVCSATAVSIENECYSYFYVFNIIYHFFLETLISIKQLFFEFSIIFPFLKLVILCIKFLKCLLMCRSLDPTLPHHKYSISLLLVWAKSLFPAFCCERSRNSTEKHFYRLTPPQQPANQPTEDQKQLWKLRPVLPNRQILYGLGLSICLFFNPFS